tara:strand:- start:924 stop:2198 length:1275 start_codon:yes stop_codon:yes gene_type:complete
MITQTLSNLKPYFKDYNLIYPILLSFCLGSFVVNLSMLICMLIFFFKFKFIKIYINQFKLIFYSTIFFWIILLISTIFNNFSDIKNIFKSFAYLRFILFPFVLIYLLDRVNKKKFILFFNLIILFLIFDIFFQFYFKFDLLGFKLEDLGNPRMDRISGFFGSEFIAGTYLSLFGFTAFFLLRELKLFNRNFFFLLYLILLISSIIITGDRVGILLILSIFLFNIVFNNYHRKFFIGFFFILIITSTILIKSSNKLSYRYIGNINSIIGINTLSEVKYENLIKSPWISHYLVSLEMIKDRPLLGFGNKGFRKYCDQYLDKEKKSSYKHKCTTHPHNTYFEILVETGFFGLFFFILFNFLIFIKIFKSNNEIVLLIYSVIFTILNPLRPSGSFFTTWSGGVFWMIVGILLYYLYINQMNPKHYIKK